MKEKYQQIVDVILRELPDVEAVYLFGSAASGLSRKDSDVDIAILPAKILSSVERWKIGGEVAYALKKEIDLIDLRQTSTVMRFQIISTGICLYSHDTSSREIFEDFVYSSYLRFNEERKDLLMDIQRRGRIYGE